MSSVSGVSIFDGLVGGDIDELRQLRNAINEDAVCLMTEYSRISAMTGQQQNGNSDEFDAFRNDWFTKVMEFIDTARTSFAAGRISHSHMKGSARFVDKCRNGTWRATRFFGQDYPGCNLPTFDDLMAPIPNPGEKRHLNNCSMLTEVFSNPPHKAVFRSSSPNPDAIVEEIEHMDASSQGAAAQLPPGAIPKTVLPGATTPGGPLPSLPPPKVVLDVNGWLQQQAATPTNPEPPILPPTPADTAAPPAPQLSVSRMHIHAQLGAQRRELEELKALLQSNAAAAAANAQAQAEAATNAINLAVQQKHQEMLQKGEQAHAEAMVEHKRRSDEIERQRQAAMEEVQKLRNEQAQIMEQHRMQIDLARAQATTEQANRARTEQAAAKLAHEVNELKRQQAELQRKANEAAQLAAAASSATVPRSQPTAGQQRLPLHHAQQSSPAQPPTVPANVNAGATTSQPPPPPPNVLIPAPPAPLNANANQGQVDAAFLPSSTPANNPASAHRGGRRLPPRNNVHPLDAELQNRQRNAANSINISENETTYSASTTAAPTGVSIITRLMGDCVLQTDWTGVTPDTFARLRQMDLDAMKSARPKHPFSTGSPVKFAMHMSSFEEATERATISYSDKLSELLFWFDGTAGSIIQQHKRDPRNDARMALAKAISELNSFFKEGQDPISSSLDVICRGRQLSSNDFQGHVDLYSELRQFLVSAQITESTSEFKRRETEIVKAIMESRLAHLADDFLRTSQRNLRLCGAASSFSDMMEEVQDWTTILKSRKPDGKQASRPKANVAAVTAQQGQKQKQTMAKRVATSPPKQQPTDKCTICGHMHSSQECNVLASIPKADDRVTELRRLRLCFHCFSADHRANECKQRPVCAKCGRRHATLLHDRSYQQPPQDKQPQASSLSAEALPFRQFQQQPQTEVATATTPSSSQATTL